MQDPLSHTTALVVEAYDRNGYMGMYGMYVYQHTKSPSMGWTGLARPSSPNSNIFGSVDVEYRLTLVLHWIVVGKGAL